MILNKLVRAIDYFIVADSPDNPYTWRNVTAEDLVKDIIAMAGLTSYAYDTSMFTFGIHNDVEVNLTSAYDYANFIANIVAFSLYGDSSGTVHFKNRRPYVVPSDTPVTTISSTISTSADNSLSDKDIRNKVVVYGADGITASASASSPYLPAGFYKTAVVAAPTVIDTTSMAQQAADYNLDLLNRPTKTATIQIIGDASLSVRTVATLDISDVGLSGDWYIYGINHDWGVAGFLTTLTLKG